MATKMARTEEGLRELSTEEGWALLEERAQRYLHMSADGFLRKWDAREFEDVDRPEVRPVILGTVVEVRQVYEGVDTGGLQSSNCPLCSRLAPQDIREHYQ